MKRRTFLQLAIGGITALFLPKAKAGVDDIVNETLDKDQNWRDTQENWHPYLKEGQKIRWRRWDDYECPCDKCQQIRTLVDRQQQELEQTLDELCRNAITKNVKFGRWAKLEPSTTPWTEGEVYKLNKIIYNVAD